MTILHNDVYPEMYFFRLPEIERETGIPLAGKLFVQKTVFDNDREAVSEVLSQIVQMAKDNALPADAEVFFWPMDGHDKADRANVDHCAELTGAWKAWAKGCRVVEVRCSEREEDGIPMDSAMARAIGIVN